MYEKHYYSYFSGLKKYNKMKFRFYIHSLSKSENNSGIQQSSLLTNHCKPYNFKVKFKSNTNVFKYTNEQLGKTNNTNAAP